MAGAFGARGSDELTRSIILSNHTALILTNSGSRDRNRANHHGRRHGADSPSWRVDSLMRTSAFSRMPTYSNIMTCLFSRRLASSADWKLNSPLRAGSRTRAHRAGIPPVWRGGPFE